MDEQLALLKTYSRERHLNLLPKDQSQAMPYAQPIYHDSWSMDKTKAPYFVLTYLLDAYYCCPERIDMSFLFLWQCINNIYNEIQLLDPTVKKSSDSTGIETLIAIACNEIAKSSTEKLFGKLASNCPDKLYSFVANTILKNYAIEKKFGTGHRKIISSSYETLKKHCHFVPALLETYGESYAENCDPKWDVSARRLELGVKNSERSNSITRSLAGTLKKLMNTGAATVSGKSGESKLSIDASQRVAFFFRSILYAVRCNTFHGNIASRLNSIYADSGSVKVARFLFQLSHFFINVGLIYLEYLPKTSIQISEVNVRKEYGDF